MSTTQDHDNPYAPPKAAVLEPASQSGTLIPDGQKVATGRGVAWYGEAWKLFTAAPGTWVLIFIVFMLLSFAVAIVPFVGSLAINICYPIVAGGLMLGCRSIEEGNGLTVGHMFEEQVKKNGRQGVAYLLEEGMTVMDAETMREVPRDGETMGEIMFRGNITMKGYLKNPGATADAFRGGWFHSGDLAVLQPDGYVKIKDRSKDVIISGGENISSQEVEDVLHAHPSVMLAAVVAQPDPKWGETPCAFIELKEGASASAEEIIEFCRARMARFKAPKAVIFGPLPKTSTGKIQKFLLREKAKSTAAIE